MNSFDRSFLSLLIAVVLSSLSSANAGQSVETQGTSESTKISHLSQSRSKKGNRANQVTKSQKAQLKGNSQSPFINGHFVLSAVMKTNGYRSHVPTVVVVDKGSHFTHVLQLQDNNIIRIMSVSNAIGTIDTPTPAGRYWIVAKKLYPRWVPPKTIPDAKPLPPYNQTHKNPLGVAAIYLNKDEIDLHGTNTPKLIRKDVSHGCVRHSNKDIMMLYSMVHAGDVVYIVRRFRGTVLKKSDFIRGNQGTQKSSGADLNLQTSPTRNREGNRTSALWYTVDT